MYQKKKYYSSAAEKVHYEHWKGFHFFLSMKYYKKTHFLTSTALLMVKETKD